MVAAPTSLPSVKHMVVRVIEEGSKRPGKDLVSMSSFVPIHKAIGKNASRNNSLKSGLPRQNGKPKKQEWSGITKVAVSNWVNDMSRELTSGASPIRPSHSDPLTDVSNTQTGVQWIDNSTFDGDRPGASH
ncbi:hypothetical protein V6N13_060811 [Hibiscus sabdariffa]|uniref:Uncharacterized protein n=1 Tax=Hibiscus sabdariffa TaxID=183260 RepID=A0ABR2P6L3_9ROSI